MPRFRFIFTLAGVLVVSCFVGTRDAYAQTKDDGGGTVVIVLPPPPSVVVNIPPLGVNAEQDRRHFKANVLNNWLNRNGLVAIPNGHGVQLLWVQQGAPLTDEQICCEIDLLMAALRRVLKNHGGLKGEDDTSGTNVFIVNVPGAPHAVRIVLLLGFGTLPKASAGGRAGDIVIVGGSHHGGERKAQGAEANTGAGGIALAGGGDAPGLDKDENGKELPSESGPADNGGDARSTAGKRGTAAACGGEGGHGGTDEHGKGGGGGESGEAHAAVTDQGAGPDEPDAPGKATAVAGQAGDGGTGSNGRDAGNGGAGKDATASVEGGPPGSKATARGGNSGNGGKVNPDVPDNDGNFGKEGKTGNAGDGETSEADKQTATGGNTGSGRNQNDKSAHVGKGTATASKDETNPRDATGTPGRHTGAEGNPEPCKSVVTEAAINGLIGN